MRRSNFIFDSVQLLCYKCCKISFKCIGSHIESPNWIKNKKATINSINGDDKCFQYALIEKVGKKPSKNTDHFTPILFSICCIKNKWKYDQPMFQNITQAMKNTSKIFCLLTGSNFKKQWWLLLIRLSSFFQNRKSDKNGFENKASYWIVISSQKDNILQLNQYIKWDKMTQIIYAKLEFWFKKYMNVQIIRKNLQKKGTISPVDFWCQLYWCLII